MYYQFCYNLVLTGPKIVFTVTLREGRPRRDMNTGIVNYK